MVREIDVIRIYKLYKSHYKLVDLIATYFYILLKPLIYLAYLFREEATCPHYKFGQLKIPKLYSQKSLDHTNYPRSGTHWLAYIISLIANDGELPDGKALYDVIKFLGGFIFTDEELEEMQDPRIFFDHMPYKVYKSIGNSKSKYIYIARNPKEVAVSQYKILKSKKPFPNNHLVGFNGEWNEFFDLFIKGETYYGSWFKHVSEWYEHKDDENILFVWYEDLLRDLGESIRKIAKFLEFPISDEIIQKIRAKASFEVMKTDRDVKVANFLLLEPSAFFRSGTNRSWEEIFTEEQNTIINQMLKRSNICFSQSK